MNINDISKRFREYLLGKVGDAIDKEIDNYLNIRFVLTPTKVYLDKIGLDKDKYSNILKENSQTKQPL